jgi:UDP-N-acetylmuramate--alanine ligase
VTIPATARIHFVGIGGAGMSALAEILLSRGHVVSGSDIRESWTTHRIRRLGGLVHVGHRSDHLAAADLVVYSRAITDDNDEVREARRRGLPILHRAEVLADVMHRGRGIAVVGTHGKTTTTAMLTRILVDAGYDPTALIGGYVAELDGNARIGAGPWIVAEVDESDGSLVHVQPHGAVLTSLDSTDHRDFYTSQDHLSETFARFLRGVPGDGFIAACIDHSGVRTLHGSVPRPITTFGFDASATVKGALRSFDGHRTRAMVWINDQPAGELRLEVPGRHNVSNALGAVAAAWHIGVPVDRALEALVGFRGASRRFEVRGEADGVLVVDDYAHNPVKVAAVLRAAREGWPQHRVIALFQPHRFSRTQTTYAEFAHAFDDADDVIITEIYGADEAPVPGVTAHLIVDAIAPHRPVHFRRTVAEAIDLVADIARPGSIVLTLGAGDIGRAGDPLVQRLAGRNVGEPAAPAAPAPAAPAPAAPAPAAPAPAAPAR